MQYRELQLLIGGRWIGGDSRETIAVVNPSTGQALGHRARADGSGGGFHALELPRAAAAAQDQRNSCRRLQAGMIGLNTFSLGVPDSISSPETPFGGIKCSGFGSEGGSEGLEAFLYLKLVSEYAKV